MLFQGHFKEIGPKMRTCWDESIIQESLVSIDRRRRKCCRKKQEI